MRVRWTGENGGRTLLDYEDRILGLWWENRVAGGGRAGPHALVRQEVPGRQVRSAVFAAEAEGGRLWGVAECQVVGQLSPEELTSLKDYLTGQAADGVGEGLEQQAIRVDGGELYVHLWQSEGWRHSGRGAFRRAQIQEPHDDVVPTEAQHNRFRWGEEFPAEMSEPCPQARRRVWSAE